VAPFIDDVWNVSRRAHPATGLRWEYLAPWHEGRTTSKARSTGERQNRLSQGAANLPPQLMPLVIIPERLLYAVGSWSATSTNFGRESVSPTNVKIAPVARGGFGVYYDNLN
jgi:hypothetical protein